MIELIIDKITIIILFFVIFLYSYKTEGKMTWVQYAMIILLIIQVICLIWRVFLT